ncbi:hypothetical protein Cantr_07323 [Candida viswanathii]|uniref:BZIP domain-containing protein n=1 Tax=Candida viswanathii TaxID=5486 RepID=A0A367Y1C7_9ASCO|nr:hypothetical protein Cantr_07323 [Candida viswanathii]
MSEETTSAALLEQLVYIDNYINGATSTDSSNATPNLDMDGQLSLDLAAFADDSFIFPDEEKKRKANSSTNDNEGSSSNDNRDSHNDNWNFHDFNQQQQQQPATAASPQPFATAAAKQRLSSTSSTFLNLTDLPKFPVPPGAKSSLVNAGLSLNQIDLLSALVAQHQASLGNSIPNQTPSMSNTTVTTPMSVSPSELPIRHNSSIHRLLISSNLSSTTNLLEPVPSSSSTLSPSNGSAAELDKKRRNTAASARFRFKKKMKEKQMETKINSLEDLIVSLEGQLNNLEMENKLLRNLIIEKGSQKSEDEVKLLREKARME